MNKEIKVLYIDDEIHNLTAFKATFRRDFKIYTASSGFEGINILENNDINVIITDQRMPQMTGVEFLEYIIPIYPEVMRILLTGYSDISAVIDAINKGKIFYYHQKPWDENELKITIENAFQLFSLKKENRELTKKLKIANEQLEFMLRQKLL